MRTLELSGSVGAGDVGTTGGRLGPLDFGDHLQLSLNREDGGDPVGDGDGLAVRPAGSVLAAAARIESLKSVPRRKMSMIGLNRQNSD